MMQEAQLLREAILEYESSLVSLDDALQDAPGEAELVELKAQLESALQEAQAALDSLEQPDVEAATAAGEAAAAAAAAAGQEALASEPTQDGSSPAQPQDQAAPADAEGAAAATAAAIGPAPRPAGSAAAASQPRGSAGGAQARGNARIHPRSKYAFEQPDFAALAERYPSLQPFLLRPRAVRAGAGTAPAADALPPGEGALGGAAVAAEVPSEASAAPARASIDFTSPAACRELTRVLLRHDFGVEWWVPLGQLVPPVTNRANYIHWLEDLLSLTPPTGPIVGLDVGCGANLIYPLLGASLCGWRMVGADVTPEALRWAARVLGANPHLSGLIELRAVGMQPEQETFLTAAGSGKGGAKGSGSGDGAAQGALAAAPPEAEQDEAGAPAAVAAAAPAAVVRLAAGQATGGGIVSGALRRGERFAFCMCNPPFFESMEEAGRNPATAFGGTAAEMVYPGGELAFVTGMVQDSLALRGAVHWYTTMVGKKGTLRAVRSLLYRHGVRALRTTELAQGKTSRWALAWSFTADAAAASQPLPRFPAAGTAGTAGTTGPGQPARAREGLAAVRNAPPAVRKLSWQVHAPAKEGVAVLAAARSALQQAGLQCRDAGPYSLCCKYTPTAGQLAVAAAEGEAGGAEGSAAKRPRVAGQSQQAQQQWQVDVQLFQQHAGLFLLSAALHKSAPDAALPWYGQAMRRARTALAARWKVQA